MSDKHMSLRDMLDSYDGQLVKEGIESACSDGCFPRITEVIAEDTGAGWYRLKATTERGVKFYREAHLCSTVMIAIAHVVRAVGDLTDYEINGGPKHSKVLPWRWHHTEEEAAQAEAAYRG